MLKITFVVLKKIWPLLLCLLLPLACQAQQFVELTAKLEINDWDYWFFTDEVHVPPTAESAPGSIFREPGTVHCIVGTNSWLVEYLRTNSAGRQTDTYWYTGTNMLHHLLEEPSGLRSSSATPSLDGNPGRPVRVADLMFGAWGKTCWLAYCSGPFLKQPNRQIPLPSDMWKETQRETNFPDKTVVFKDSLGLPQRICEYGRTNQLILHYQVHESTNVLGWNFPLEFYLVQYYSSQSNGWQVHLTAKGKVTSIKPVDKLEVPAEVLSYLHKH